MTYYLQYQLIIITFPIYQNYFDHYNLKQDNQITMKSIQSTQQHRYRSVKYKINRDISLSVNQTVNDKQIFLPSTSKFTNTHSRRNGNKFSVTYLSQFKNNSVMNSENREQQKARRFSYMDSFHFMLNMQRNKYNTKQKEKQQEQLQKVRQKQRQDNPQITISIPKPRVQLPALNQLDSYFTVLDNIHLPINYINEQLPRISKQIATEHENIKKIGHQIKQINKKAMKQLAAIEQIGVKGFEKLRNMIKANRVSQQQQSMKLKNALEKCRDYLPQYYNTFQQNKTRIVSLQTTIFKGTPFQLQQQKQFQAISSKYF